VKIFLALFSSCLALAAADLPEAPPLLHPDGRYKADVLLVVAHPDDDMILGGYLAKLSLDERKRVAAVYCTPGDGGGNVVGNEAGAALGQMRILEARRALAAYGIENVWFLGGHDTPGQDVLWSLDNWNHGRMLNDLVRIVRITRPEVILTFLPNYVAGENHADHQAAGVLATEAFDTAGDPLQFPEQVSPSRDRQGMMNLTEGLLAWQPKKLYYFTDAFEDFGPYWHDKQDLSPYRKNFLDGRGPSYSRTEVSPARHKSYARLTAEQQTYYLTQEGSLGTEALEKNDVTAFEYPVRLLYGKSVVGGRVIGDVFEGVSPGAAPLVRVPGYQGRINAELSLDLGGPWLFYREFWKAHDLGGLAELLPVPEAAVSFGATLHIPLLIRNGTKTAEEIKLTAVLPSGWIDKAQYGRYRVEPGDSYPVLAEVVAPAASKLGWQEIAWNAEAGGRRIGTVTLRVLIGKSGGLPQ
jgi:LmbE family N-acetylglucosaminyl deacetylase